MSPSALICFCGVALGALVALTSATVVQQCQPLTGKIEEGIEISPCPRTPCRLRKKSTIEVTIKFTPERDVDKLVNNINAVISGLPFPFIGVDGTDACKTIFTADGVTKAGCPLKKGQTYVYKDSFNVLDIYPRLKVLVRWGLRDPVAKANVVCFEVNARITN